ncbi:unnamed protein product, partial [marine sediment metagenome]
DLKTAQESLSATPYIYIDIDDSKGAGAVNYGTAGRLISLVYYEEPYRERATIVLDNHDRALDPGTLDLRGQYFEIGYGYNTTSGDKYSLTPGLWVKSQHAYSSEGVTICVLECEGIDPPIGYSKPLSSKACSV